MGAILDSAEMDLILSSSFMSCSLHSCLDLVALALGDYFLKAWRGKEAWGGCLVTPPMKHSLFGSFDWWRFSDTIDRATDFALGIKTKSHTEQTRRYDFYVKTQLRKNHGEEGENSLFSRGHSELSRAILCLSSLPLLDVGSNV